MLFPLADTTPPRLTFTYNPRYSNTNVTITWRYNEEATSTCTIQTPTTILIMTCDQNVTLTNLQEGGHTLYITARDVAGNVANTRYSWIVGTYVCHEGV